MRHSLTRILIPFVYFIAGSVALASVAATFFYKDELGLSPAQVGLLGSLSIIPWSIKPLYGFFSDRVPIAGMRRKPYLMLAGLLSAGGYWSLALFVTDFRGALICILIAATGFAMADVIVDGMVAEMSRTQKEAGKLQSICRGAFLGGALIFSPLSGILVSTVGPRVVYMLTGSLPVLTIIFAFLIHEGNREEEKRLMGSLKERLKSVLRPEILWAAVFLFVWRATPTSGGAFTFFLIDEYEFTAQFFGWLNTISYAVGIVAVVYFRKKLIAVPLRKLFFWVMMLSVVLSLPSIVLVYGWHTYLGVSPQLFALADTVISAPLSELGFLPVMVLIARVCPKGIEATVFALLASFSNIALAVSDAGGAFLVKIFDIRQSAHTLGADYSNLHLVLWIAILSSFLAWPFLHKIPETRAGDDFDDHNVTPSAKQQGVRLTEMDTGSIV